MKMKVPNKGTFILLVNDILLRSDANENRSI